jgi:hypothetical protein
MAATVQGMAVPLAWNRYIGHPIGNVLRVVLFAEKKQLHWEARGGYFELIAAIIDPHPTFFQHFQRVLLQAPGFLHGNFELG